MGIGRHRRLVPVAVLAAVLALFFFTRSRTPPPPGIAIDSDVEACRQHLLAIYDGLRAYRERTGTLPRRPGVGFFASLIADGIWPDDETHRAWLTCPGPGAQPVSAACDASNPEAWSASCSAFAGRDVERFPIPAFPAGGTAASALIACDNAQGWNHPGLLNVLYTDRTVKTFDAEALVAAGVLSSTNEAPRPGPDSPLEDLRVLRRD